MKKTINILLIIIILSIVGYFAFGYLDTKFLFTKDAKEVDKLKRQYDSLKVIQKEIIEEKEYKLKLERARNEK